MNIKRVFILGIILTMFLLMASPIAQAANVEETNSLGITDKQVFVTGNENDKNIDTGIPDVSIDEVSSWADRKGFQIVSLLQRFAQPFSIIMFIGCAVLTLIGAFGNSNLISKGIMGMVITAVVYSVILYAPEILDIFLGFMRS